MPPILSKWHREPARRNRSGIFEYEGQINLGATGAIAAGGNDTPGFTVTKTAGKTGRYDVQLKNADGTAVVALQLTNFCLTVLTASADVAYTTAKGAYAILRNNNISTTGAFQFQMVRSDTAADAEAEDNAKLILNFGVKVSSAVP